MKILMLNYEFPPIGGGAAPVTRELCRQLAIEVEGASHDIFTYDFARGGEPTKMSFDGASHWPSWTPDGRRLTFRSWKTGTTISDFVSSEQARYRASLRTSSTTTVFPEEAAAPQMP